VMGEQVVPRVGGMVPGGHLRGHAGHHISG
jgi:hypothetical protein